ncbi:hypothetical protein FRUB_05980 [Fimbriiglobus ruber]|uniref:7-cyano-7-deazaguanine synthase n=1 Tax=Fimbriiglobus ruber TaxID=1908690 RepID=A0A225DTH1_9BACT|nr:hypothetical protein FRUB_05980 [Fimbriiglobus ruber]
MIVCGGAEPPSAPGTPPVVRRLDIGDKGGQVRLKFDQLAGLIHTRPSPAELDLIEIAAYVFAADQTVSRGGPTRIDYGDRWRRTLRFHIPVRRSDLWSRRHVRDALRDALEFLTDDQYEFSFTSTTARAADVQYLLDRVGPSAGEFDEVALFSGGADSLCGAIDATAVRGRRQLLVSHRPVNHVYARQQALYRAVADRRRAGTPRPAHVGVTAHLADGVATAHTQRSRSFLFAAVGGVIARRVGLSELRFYENGIISLNLPISPQVIGGRASRTTHPQALARLARLLSLVFESEFAVVNPFEWATRAELLVALHAAGHADLLADTVSCIHTRDQTTGAGPHCGRCSQCVDRRLSVLAAGLGPAHDPPAGYREDVLVGARDGADLLLVERFVGAALDVRRIASPVAFAAHNPEVNRALRYYGLPPAVAAERVFDLCRRHSDGMSRAVARALGEQVNAIVGQTVPPASLLGLILGRMPTPIGLPPAVGPDTDPERLIVDPARFTVRTRGRECFFGNTNEFHLVARMARSVGDYVPYDALREAVWPGIDAESFTIQKTMSNARRKLVAAGLTELVFDGRQKQHYRLQIAAATVAR